MARDFMGVDIAVGDTVVYPGRSGSHLWLNVATIAGIDHETHRYTGLKEVLLRMKLIRIGREDRLVVTRFPQRVVVVRTA